VIEVKRDRPNVVLIAADTVRPDHLSCYGYSRPTSPNVDRLAAEGARFDDFQAAQIPTHPAFTTLLTGVDPLYHGILQHSGDAQLSPRVPMLAERLQAMGYLSLAVDNMMAMQSAPGWFARGFQHFRVYRYQPGTGQSRAVTDRALQCLAGERSADQPFFLFVHYFDPHTPYLPPAGFRRRFYRGDEFDPANTSLRALIDPVDELTPLLLKELRFDEITDLDFVMAQYDGEIAFMDQEIGRLLEAIDEGGLKERTLVVFLSDHGEAFGEGGLTFDHHGLFDAVTRCALVMRLPGVVPAGIAIDHLTSSVDLSPTILDLIGVPPITPVEIAGKSLVPLVTGGPAVRESAPLGEASRQISRGIVTKEWKLIEPIVETADGEPVGDFLGRPRDRASQLFHRPTDPGEARNVAEQHPGVVAQLRAAIRHRRDVCAAFTGVTDPFRLCRPTLRYDGMVRKFRQRGWPT
jgi:arylsulfatase A-like enzyme